MSEMPPPPVPPQTPPQMAAPEPPAMAPKKSNVGMIIAIIVGAILLCCCGGGMYFFFQMKKGVGGIAEIMYCQSDLSAIHGALVEYADEHNGLLPKAETWEDDIRPYYAKHVKPLSKEDEEAMKTLGIKRKGPNDPWGCNNGKGGTTGYAFNSELSGKKLDEIEDKNTVVIFEVDQQGKNVHEVYKHRPTGADNPNLMMNIPRPWATVTIDGVVGGFEGEESTSSSSSESTSEE